MKRRWFALFGGFFLLISGAAVALFGSTVVETPRLAVGIAIWALVGCLDVVGGAFESVAGIAWYRFVGLGDILLGLWLFGFAISWYLGGPTTDAVLVSVGASALGGLTVAAIGVDWFRGGRHVDLSAFESGPIR